MTIKELNRDQLIEIKQNYYMDLLDERNETPSYSELSDIDELVSDGTIFEEYALYTFTDDDFFCSGGM